MGAAPLCHPLLMRITGLHSYPIKGCRGLDHDAAVTEPWGLLGDRRWMIVDDEGVGITQREVPAMARLRAVPRPGGLSLQDADVAEPFDGPKETVRVFAHKPPVTARLAPAATALLTDFLGRPARLVWMADPTGRPVQANALPSDRVSLADGFPVLLTNTASLAALPVTEPMGRFRPNVVVEGGNAWEEDSWIGGRVRLGEVVFRVAQRCNRCVVINVDQRTGERTKEPLRTLGRERRIDKKLPFGVYMIPELAPGETGILRRGDEVVSLSPDEVASIRVNET
jgi:uncharacterized protein